jgi:phenylpropionate dioxygenase-like ring-hydroxylating dioxygenase large terminal subunit
MVDVALPMKDDRYTETELLPSERYTSREWLELEYEKLWPHVWQTAGREEDIPEVGDLLEYRVGNQSYLLVRDEDMSIKAFHNSCMHRGTLLIEGRCSVNDIPCSPGNEGKIQCAFHGWSYNLDGSIHFVPGRADFADGMLDDNEIRLREIAVDTWGGFIFINPDKKNAGSLVEWLGPMHERLAKFNLDQMRTVQHLSIVVDANWKLAVEQFHENYHAWITHIVDINDVGSPATGPGGRQAGQPGAGRGGGVPPAAIMNMFEYERFPVGHSMFYQNPASWYNTAGLPAMPIGELPPNPREFITKALAYMIHNRRIAPYEVEYFESLKELPLEMKGPDFLVWLRRNACKELGVGDLAHVEDSEMFGFPIEYLFFPNMTGPVAGNSYLNLRMRPNGMDPDSSIFEIRSLFLYPEGKAPEPERDFISDWEADQDRIPVEFLQDFAMYRKIQLGFHQRSLPGHRLNRQEHNARFYERVIDSYLNGKSGGKKR